MKGECRPGLTVRKWEVLKEKIGLPKERKEKGIRGQGKEYRCIGFTWRQEMRSTEGRDKES